MYIYIHITRAHVCEACFLQKNGPFFGTAWSCFCCGSVRSNAHSLNQAPMVAMNVRRMLDVMAGYLNRRMFGYVFLLWGTTLGATWKNLHRASQCKWQQTPIQAHSLPFACWAGSCLLCCQPELSLNRHRPDYQELCHDRLSEWKLKGDELSTQ